MIINSNGYKWRKLLSNTDEYIKNDIKIRYIVAGGIMNILCRIKLYNVKILILENVKIDTI